MTTAARPRGYVVTRDGHTQPGPNGGVYATRKAATARAAEIRRLHGGSVRVVALRAPKAASGVIGTPRVRTVKIARRSSRA